MTYSYYTNKDGQTLVAQHSETSGSIRMNDKRTVYSMAGSGKRVLKADALRFIETAKQVGGK